VTHSASSTTLTEGSAAGEVVHQPVEHLVAGRVALPVGGTENPRNRHRLVQPHHPCHTHAEQHVGVLTELGTERGRHGRIGGGEHRTTLDEPAVRHVPGGG